ncbi:MAG: T9SS type A sorting domain-containing protein, partial [Pontibacter sp.]|nr:T9SS type A sorting domain-containing protein [Pontibacter sp.]
LLLVLEGGQAFRATSVTDGSLVISGNRAYFTGTGRLTRRNTAGGLETDPRRLAYLVSAVDADFRSGKGKPGKGKDRLRLVIWQVNENGSKGEVLYDNQLSCNLDLNAAACQEIERGSIVIHKRAIKSISDLLATAAAEPAAQGLTAYPTAFSDRATLSFSTETGTDYILELYDLKGALVRKLATGTAKAGQRLEHELQAEGLQKGLYLVRLTTGTETQTVKVVVQK